MNIAYIHSTFALPICYSAFKYDFLRDIQNLAPTGSSTCTCSKEEIGVAKVGFTHVQIYRRLKPTCGMDFHRVRFIEHQPKAIHCLAFSQDTDHPRLAVSRSDCSIEIWASGDGLGYHQELWVPGREDSSIEALVWCQERLFSAGLTGRLEVVAIKNYVTMLSLSGDHRKLVQD